jgi:hypothetical protein
MGKRIWYNGPWDWSPKPHRLYGSDDDNGCTYALGTPLTGILVIKRRPSICFHWTKKFHEGHIELRQETYEDAGWVKAVEFSPQVSAFLGREKDNLVSIEVRTEDKPKWSYFRRHNLGYLDLYPKTRPQAKETRTVHSQVNLDYDVNDRLIGVEVFGV